MVTVIELDRYENIWAFNTITALLKLVWEYFVHLFDSGPYGITRHSRNKGKICFYFLSGGSYYRICHPGGIMPHCAGVINSDIAWSHFKFSRTWSGYIHLYDHLVMLWNMNIYDKSVSLCHGEMEVIHKTVTLHEYHSISYHRQLERLFKVSVFHFTSPLCVRGFQWTPLTGPVMCQGFPCHDVIRNWCWIFIDYLSRQWNWRSVWPCLPWTGFSD